MARPPRFIYGFLSQSNLPFNIKIPWEISTQDGAFAMNYLEEDAILDDLVAWAETNWGERPYRFQFGLDAIRYLFDPGPLTKERLLANAKDQLRKYFPKVQVDQLQILTREDDPTLENDNQIRFILKGSIKTNKKKDINLNRLIGT